MSETDNHGVGDLNQRLAAVKPPFVAAEYVGLPGDRLCSPCESEKKVRLCKHDLEVSPSGKLALCRKCPFVGVWRDGMWERAGDTTARVQVVQWLRDNERQARSLGLLDQAALFAQAAEVIEGFLRYARMECGL